MNMRSIQSILTALCGGFLVASYVPGLAWAAYVSVLCGSYFAIGSAWESLRSRTIDVNLLMVLAAIGSIAIGHADDAAALLFLFSLSSTLEAYAMSRTRDAIASLVKLRPSEAVLLTSEGEARVPVEQLKKGDRVRVIAFDSIPVDGEILEGSTSVNQAVMTGESRPVARTVGEPLLAGTQNLEGTIVMRVEGVVGDSALDKIVSLVQDAQENKASGERISQWFGQTYTLFVLGAFVLSMVVRMGLGSTWAVAIGASLTLLVALSPCALVISTPASTLSALTWAARHGILIRGGEFIERLGQIDVITLDKTGTLTTGKPSLNEICLCTSVAASATCGENDACWSGVGSLTVDAERVLRLVAAAEVHSNHPLAEAIVRAAKQHELSIPDAIDHTVVPGKGVLATVEGVSVRVGQLSFFDAELPEAFVGHVRSIQDQGMTAVVAQVGEDYAALGLTDTIRPGARDSLAKLRRIGVKEIAMLTGDSELTAKAVATETGIDRYFAGLLPEDKEKIIAKMADSGDQVMMVGDGVNDAPSLARAGVGVAMGGLGSDVALNAADVVLMHDDLERLPQMIGLGRRTNGVIKANLIFATLVILTLTVTSLLGKLPLPIAVLGHEGSTVLVILNGLRLLGGPRARLVP